MKGSPREEPERNPRSPRGIPWHREEWPSPRRVVWLTNWKAAPKPPDCACPCCRGSYGWWRLAGPESPARPWICPRCHPPAEHLRDEEIERRSPAKS